MKIISGDAESLIGLVRKRVEERIGELDSSLENETSERLGKARKQAKQLREQIIKQAGKDAERIHKEIMQSAQQEAKQIMIKARGAVEESLFNEIRGELLDFVKGKKKIGALSYDNLVTSAVNEGKKKKTSFKLTKHEEGVVLSSEGNELDLRVDSMLSLLRTLPIKEVLTNK